MNTPPILFLLSCAHYSEALRVWLANGCTCIEQMSIHGVNVFSYCEEFAYFVRYSEGLSWSDEGGDPRQTMNKLGIVEVDQQAQFDVDKTQIGKQLLVVDRSYFELGFAIGNDFVLNV